MKRLLVAAAAACSMGMAQAELENTNLVLCGASPGGMWSTIGVGVDTAVKASYSGASATYQTSSGGPANVMQVKRKTCAIGLANDGDLAAAVKGEAPFKEPVEDILALGVMLDWLPVMWLARKDFADRHEIRSLSDLVEKEVPARIVMNRRGLLTSDITTAILEHVGATVEDIESWGGAVQYQPSGEQASLMQNGRVDIMANTLFESDRSVMETSQSVDMVMLDVPEEANQAAIERYFLKPWTIKAGAMPWHDRDVETVSTSVILFTDSSMSEEHAYAVTKAIIENAERISGLSNAMKPFTADIMTQQNVVPLHPGAIRAYEEAGLL